MKKQYQSSSMGKAVKIGAGIAAATAAAYLLFGPEKKKNREKVRGWAVKMKGEIIEKFEKAKEITEPVYNQIIDQVYKEYSRIKNIDQAELDAIVADIRKHWKAISKPVKSTKTPRTTTKKGSKPKQNK